MMSSHVRTAEPIGMLTPGVPRTGAPVAVGPGSDIRPAPRLQPRGAVDDSRPDGRVDRSAHVGVAEADRRRLRVTLSVYDRDGARTGVVAVHEPLARLGGMSMVFFRPDREAVYLACVDCDPALVSADDVRAAVEGAGFRSGEPREW